MIEIPGRNIPTCMRVLYNGTDITPYASMINFLAADKGGLFIKEPEPIREWREIEFETCDIQDLDQLIFITLN